MYNDCFGSLEFWKAAQVTGVCASVGWKLTGALPHQRRSWRYIVGGVDEAERSMSPMLESAITVGGEGWGCWDGSIKAVGMEYAWTEGLRVVVKYKMSESGEKRRRRGAP
jgi:hypothetical protein